MTPSPRRIEWLRVLVWTPLLLLGAVISCGALAVIGYAGPRLLAALLAFAGAHPWVLVLVVLALVVWIAKAAGRENQLW